MNIALAAATVLLCLGAAFAQTVELDCTFESGYCDDEVFYSFNRPELTKTNFFVRRDDPTPSQETGPNTGNSGFYAHLEASNFKFNDSVTIEMTRRVSQQDACVSFDYQMLDESRREMGSLIVQTETNNQAFTNFEVISGNQGSDWKTFKRTVPGFQRVRWMLTRGIAYRGDIAVDNLKVVTGPCDGGSGAPAPATQRPAQRPTQAPATPIPTQRPRITPAPFPGPGAPRPAPGQTPFQPGPPRPVPGGQPDFSGQNDVFGARDQNNAVTQQQMEEMQMQQQKEMKAMKMMMEMYEKVMMKKKMMSKPMSWEMCEKMADSYTVALIGGPNATIGRVQINYGGEWGTICSKNNEFTEKEAEAVCKSMGMYGGRVLTDSQITANMRRNPPSAIHLGNVRCHKDMYLQECCKNQIGVNDNCNHSEDVYVQCLAAPKFCETMMNMTMKEDMGMMRNMGCAKMPEDMGYSMMREMGEMDPEMKKKKMAAMKMLMPKCMMGAATPYTVSLIGGENATMGRLEVYYDGQWGTVCNDSFGEKEAMAACKQMGFKGGKMMRTVTENMRRRLRNVGQRRSLVAGVRCQKGDYLKQCCMNALGVSNCQNDRDVFLMCEPWPKECEMMKMKYEKMMEKKMMIEQAAQCLDMSPEEFKEEMKEAFEMHAEMAEMDVKMGEMGDDMKKKKKGGDMMMEMMKMMMGGMEGGDKKKGDLMEMMMKMMMMAHGGDDMGEDYGEDDYGDDDRMGGRGMGGGRQGMGGGRGMGNGGYGMGMGGGYGMGGMGNMMGGMDPQMMMAYQSLIQMSQMAGGAPGGDKPMGGMPNMGGMGGMPNMGGMGGMGGAGSPMEFLQMLMRMMEQQRGMSNCNNNPDQAGGDQRPMPRPDRS